MEKEQEVSAGIVWFYGTIEEIIDLVDGQTQQERRDYGCEADG